MIGQKRSPALRGRGPSLREQAGDGTLGHIDAELEELGMDSWGAPERIRRGHSPDQDFDLGVDGRVTTGGPGELGPVFAEAAPLPPQDCVRGHDQERPPPTGPDSGQRDPEEPIGSAKWGLGHCSLVDGELLAQGQVLEGELAVAAEEEGQETEQAEQESDHGAEIVRGSEPTNQSLDCRTGFWRKTVSASRASDGAPSPPLAARATSPTPATRATACPRRTRTPRARVAAWAAASVRRGCAAT